jgi:hypothetical protein
MDFRRQESCRHHSIMYCDVKASSTGLNIHGDGRGSTGPANAGPMILTDLKD